MEHKNRLICVTGPTASGKTALSVALAQAFQTEIISADSMQIYRGMDIGTAKPTTPERCGICHHVLDVVDPGESFSVARFVGMADAAAQDILRRGSIPIVAGGTALYMDALIAGDAFSEEENDSTVRERLNALAAEHGVRYMHELLRKVDPESAERLHPNNLKRVIRALEVHEQTGKTIGELNAQNKRPAPKYDALMIGLCPANRETLYARIDARVDKMMAEGLLAEAEGLYAAGKLVGTAAQAIGYKELLGYLRGRESLEVCTETLKQRSRNYAKRQLTWLKRDDRIHWIYYNENAELPHVLQDSTEYLRTNGV